MIHLSLPAPETALASMLRLECLRLAVELRAVSTTPQELMARADQFADYVYGVHMGADKLKENSPDPGGQASHGPAGEGKEKPDKRRSGVLRR